MVFFIAMQIAAEENNVLNEKITNVIKVKEITNDSSLTI